MIEYRKHKLNNLHLRVCGSSYLKLHLSHASDRNAIAACREEQQSLLIGHGHVENHVPESPASTNNTHITITYFYGLKNTHK